MDQQGKHAEADALYREVLAMQKRVLGDEHPDTLRTVRNLPNTLDRRASTLRPSCSIRSEPEPQDQSETTASGSTNAGGRDFVKHGVD